MTNRAGSDHQPPGRRQPGPFVADCLPGKYAYCQCQGSRRFPYCDGSHRDAAGAVGPLKVILDRATRVAWCACGESRRKPYCDGSHADTVDG
ncbi:MAG: CDGSH iron-sulfur domain-containing protein [Planctomycetota bacterium]